MTSSAVVDDTGLPVDGAVLPIDGYQLKVLEGRHPIEKAHAEAIAANWQLEQRANPSLYNGELILQERISLEGRQIHARGYVADYASFLWWRKVPGRPGACHLFGYPVLVSSDGALIAVRMSDHTANPGQVYFAAGSVEPVDVVAGECDLAGNMAREVLEETGLSLSEAKTDGQLYASYRTRRLTLFQLFHFSDSADQLIARIRKHAQECGEKEISDAVAITSADLSLHRYNPAMQALLQWYFR
ncbi:NUDIX domain-containing protein [Peteryoungia desertarenae]|uniref:NUDIX domain-containing protein n=1 Tax=Peteryoungia desertarenae TaxID=1813451 RepID=A0ABX6QRE7_9HYPH|nr:NUDIX hydrolase [Peteryoungia desertarenae]QLF70772.1 NUDIX domain-containing protein [Peteryoungia desertarenae]